jgi:hypothetical protein
MARPQYYGNFDNLAFPKTGSEIKTKAAGLRVQLLEKVEERKKRIQGLATEMALTDPVEVLMNLDELIKNTSSNTAGATVGNKAALQREVAARKSELEEIGKLDLIVRNLPESESFKLSFQELTYFGF